MMTVVVALTHTGAVKVRPLNDPTQSSSSLMTMTIHRYGSCRRCRRRSRRDRVHHWLRQSRSSVHFPATPV
jgi:hypothetical protein